MLKTIFQTTTVALICLSVISCAKEQPGVKSYDVCGTYSLTQMLFYSSDHVDLDGDGQESDNFLDEFKRLDGYSDSRAVATVYRRPSDKSEIVIDFHIPYHDVRIDNNNTVDCGCGYIEASLIGKIDGMPDCEENPLVFIILSGVPDKNRIGEFGIDDVRLKEFGVYGQMKINVHCTIYDSCLKPHEETLYMLFMKDSENDE